MLTACRKCHCFCVMLSLLLPNLGFSIGFFIILPHSIFFFFYFIHSRTHNSVLVAFISSHSFHFHFPARVDDDDDDDEEERESFVGGATVAEIQVFLIIYLSINQFGFILYLPIWWFRQLEWKRRVASEQESERASEWANERAKVC